MWGVLFQHLFHLCTCKSIVDYLRHPRLLIEMCLCPPGILFIREVLLPLLQSARLAKPSFPFVSLQVGFLRLLLLYTSHGVPDLVHVFVQSPMTQETSALLGLDRAPAGFRAARMRALLSMARVPYDRDSRSQSSPSTASSPSSSSSCAQSRGSSRAPALPPRDIATRHTRACNLHDVLSIPAQAGLMHWIIGSEFECSLVDDGTIYTHSNYWQTNCTTTGLDLYSAVDQRYLHELLDDPALVSCARGTLSARLGEYFYFSLVTMGTVGYGDWSPPDLVTRIIGIAMVAALMSYVPIEISHLIDSAQQMSNFCMGRLPRHWDDFVVILGPIPPKQLEQFVLEFCQMRETAEQNTRFLALTPLYLDDYRTVLSSTVKQQLYVQRGDLLDDSKNPLPVNMGQVRNSRLRRVYLAVRCARVY